GGQIENDRCCCGVSIDQNRLESRVIEDVAIEIDQPGVRAGHRKDGRRIATRSDDNGIEAAVATFQLADTATVGNDERVLVVRRTCQSLDAGKFDVADKAAVHAIDNPCAVDRRAYQLIVPCAGIKLDATCNDESAAEIDLELVGGVSSGEADGADRRGI